LSIKGEEEETLHLQREEIENNRDNSKNLLIIELKLQFLDFPKKALKIERRYLLPERK